MSFTGILAGHPVYADNWSEDLGPWTAYTPVWSSSGTQPALGNGTIVGAYRQVGKTVDVVARLLMGSTSTFGTGSYFISLPTSLPAKSASPRAVGGAYLLDSGTAAKSGIAAVDGTLTVVFFASSTSQVTSTSPHTWAVSDEIAFFFTYEVA